MIEHTVHTLPHGIDLACRTCGDAGRPLLVFLHGFPEAAFVWDDLHEHFAQATNGGYRCVAPNLRGYAPSSAPADAAAYRAKHLIEDIAALIAAETGSPSTPAAAVIAHDWGGAVAWGLAASRPACLQRLAIINSPHPATFLRELQSSTAQQQASAYMNFLIRPDAEALLAAGDYRRLWEFFTKMGAAEGPHAWLTDTVKAQYRAVWDQGLTGALNYYRASPLRPPRSDDDTGAPLVLPRELTEVLLPTLVIWAMADTALPPALLVGLESHVPQMTLVRIDGATHWVIHEQPALVIQHLQAFLQPQ